MSATTKSEEAQATAIPTEVLLMSTGFFFVFMGAGAFQQYLIPYLTEKGVVTAFQASVVLATVYLSFLVWRAVIAFTLYSIGEYWSTFLGACTYALFALSALLLGRLELLLLAAVVWGWGAAAMWISSSTQLLDVTAHTHYGRANGLLFTATTGGQALGVVVLGGIMSWLGPQSGPLAATLITALGAALFLFLPFQHSRRIRPRLTPVLRVLVVPRTGLVSLFLFLSSLAFGLILGSFSQIIGTARGAGMLALVTAGYWFLRIFGSYGAGYMADKLGREHVLVLSFAIAGCGLLAPVLWPGIVTLSLAALCMGLLNSAVPVATNALIGDLAEFENRHLMLASIYVWRDVGVAVAILGGAWLLAAIGNERAVFTLFSLAFLASAAFALWLKGRPVVQVRASH